MDATLEFLDVATNVVAGSTLKATGDGNVDLRGGVYTVQADATATFGLKGKEGLWLDGVELEAEGKLRNQHNMTIKEAIITGGTVTNGVVTGGIENMKGATLTIDKSSGIKSLNGVMQNNGIVRQEDNDDDNINELVVPEGRLLNHGEYILEAGTTISVFREARFTPTEDQKSAFSFDNAGGTLRQVGRAVEEFEQLFSYIDVPFNLSEGGKVIVEGNGLSLAGGGTHTGSGSFYVAKTDLGALDLGSNLPHIFDGDFEFSGSGAVSYANVVVRTGTLTNRVESSAGTDHFVTVFGGHGPTSLNAVGGTFVNKGVIVFDFNTNIYGGTATESGSDKGFKNLGGEVKIGVDEDGVVVGINDGVLLNAGEGFASGIIVQRGDLHLDNATILNDKDGLLRFHGPAGRKITSASKFGEFRNNGAFRNRGGDILVTDKGDHEIQVPFTMTGGNVKVESGKLTFSGVSSHEESGKFQVDKGAGLVFANDVNVSGDYTITGKGVVSVLDKFRTTNHVVTELTEDGKIIFDGDFVGGVEESQVLVNRGNAEWKQGTLGRVLNIGGRLDITGNATRIVDGLLSNTGTVEHHLSATVASPDIDNSGLYYLRGKFAAHQNDMGTIINRPTGRFSLEEDNVERTFSGRFNNLGTVVVESDSTLNLTGDVVQLKKGSLRNTLEGGTWIVNGATLNLEADRKTVGLLTGMVVLERNGKLSALPDSSMRIRKTSPTLDLFTCA